METPINIKALVRFKHKKWNKGEKANVWICGMDNIGWQKEEKCEVCGKKCFSTPQDFPDLVTKKAKKICVECALFNPKWSKKLNKEQREILELSYYGKYGKCCKCEKKKAIGYFGIGEPDIKPIPLCEDCKIKMQYDFFKEMQNENST